MSEAPPKPPPPPDIVTRLRAFLRGAPGRVLLVALLLGLGALLWRGFRSPSPAATPVLQSHADAGVVTPSRRRLQGARALRGTVIDDRHSPLADAQVRVRSLEDPRALPWETSTDEEGHFAFDDLVAHPLSVEVSRVGHDAAERILSADDAGELSFVLARQGQLLVQLHDLPGQAVEGAVVTVSGPGLWPAAELRSNDQGEALFPDLATGEYEARARRGGRVAEPVGAIQVVPGQRAQVALTLKPGVSLNAQITDATRKTPLAEVALLAYEPTPGIAPRTATSDAEGHVTLEGFVPGALRLELRRDGYAPLSVDVSLPSSAPLALAMQGEAALSGSVVDESGHPIEAALLSVATREGLPVLLDPGVREPTDGVGELGVTKGPVPKIPIDGRAIEGLGTLAARSDAHGHFRIEGLPPSPIVLSAAQSGYAPATLEISELTPHQELSDVRVVLRRAGRIAGRIEDARGRPVSGVYVSARGADGALHSALSDDAGRFVFADLLGDVSVFAEPHGLAPLSCKVKVTPDVTSQCDLKVGAVLHTLSLRVVDSYGFGLGGTVVQATSDSAARAFTQMTGADGTATLRELPAPPYQLTAAKPGYVPVRLEVSDTERTLRVELKRGANVAGLVTDVLGRPVPGAKVRTEDGTAETTSDPGGSFMLDDLAPGALRVTAALEGVGEGVSSVVRARAGETLESVRVVLSGRYLPQPGRTAVAAGAREARTTKATDAPAKPADFQLERRGDDVLFVSVLPGGPAARAGLRSGDVLVRVDGEPVLSPGQGRGMLRDPPGHTALVQLRRDGSQVRLRYRRPPL